METTTIFVTFLVGITICHGLFDSYRDFRRHFHLRNFRLSNIPKNNSTYSYRTSWLNATLDHFNFANEKTFPLRYLINEQNFGGEGYPIFLYTGNEGDIVWFAENTGLMWDIGPEFGATIIFVEHRYYGESLPFGNLSYSNPKHLGFLTSEQALADFVDVITFLKSPGSKYQKSPVIAFGGSYGGMLSAWMRMKYPNIVAGALAASAPIWQFTGLTPCNSFDKGVTYDFHLADSTGKCVDSVKRSWKVIDSISSVEGGLQWLTKAFRLCSPLKSGGDLKSWLKDVLGNVAMVNYPYEANFLNPLPAWPVRHMCVHLSNNWDGEKLMFAMRDAMLVYFNHTGQASCLDIGKDSGGGLAENGWWYQSCSEMVMPFCSTGTDDFFEPTSWNFSSFAASCQAKWGVKPRPSWVLKQYWAKNISQASNIIFSNGDLDPWKGGGVLVAPHDKVIPLMIKQGAHHLDLRSSNPKDPQSVVKARKVEKQLIYKFIKKSKH